MTHSTESSAIRIHPAATIFPLMDEAAYQALKADIETNGQKEPVVFYRKQLLDGRNRARACEELGLRVGECELDDSDDPIAYVLSANLHRRHLTSGQRAVVAIEIEPMLAGEAEARQKSGKSSDMSAGGRGKTLGNSLPKVSDDGKATQQAAKLTGTNRQYVGDAKKIKATAPEMMADIKSGKITIPAAKKKLEKGKPAPDREPGDDTDAIEAEKAADQKTLAELQAPYDELLTALVKVRKMWNSLAGDKFHAVHCAQKNQRVTTALTDCRAAISTARPACKCKRCAGKGCQKCHQSGYWPKSVLDAVEK